MGPVASTVGRIIRPRHGRRGLPLGLLDGRGFCYGECKEGRVLRAVVPARERRHPHRQDDEGSAMTEEELEEMLERVPRSHPRFVEGVLSDAEEFGTADGIACFIRESPGLGAGYVAEHSAKLAGLM